jgi:hypothetical protein
VGCHRLQGAAAKEIEERKVTMRKFVCFMTALVILSPMVLLADETSKNEDMSVTPQEKILTVPRHEMGVRVDMHKGISCPCCGMMGKASMEMAQDGSVVVLMGDKLLKYDKDLALVKQVEVPVPEMIVKRHSMGGEAAEKDSASVAAGPREKTA